MPSDPHSRGLLATPVGVRDGMTTVGVRDGTMVRQHVWQQRPNNKCRQCYCKGSLVPPTHASCECAHPTALVLRSCTFSVGIGAAQQRSPIRKVAPAQPLHWWQAGPRIRLRSCRCRLRHLPVPRRHRQSLLRHSPHCRCPAARDCCSCPPPLRRCCPLAALEVTSDSEQEQILALCVPRGGGNLATCTRACMTGFREAAQVQYACSPAPQKRS